MVGGQRGVRFFVKKKKRSQEKLGRGKKGDKSLP